MCAGLIAFVAISAHSSGGWFPGLFDNVAIALVPAFLLLGLFGIFLGARWNRGDRDAPLDLGLRDSPMEAPAQESRQIP